MYLSRSRSRSWSLCFVRDQSTGSSTCMSTRKFIERLPDRFDGTCAWRDYWAHFEACWKLNGYSDGEAALVLATSLSGSAYKVLSPKPRDSRGEERPLTITELKARLETRYGNQKLPESFLAQLKTRQQNPHETIQELGAAISELVHLAYPDAPMQLLNRMEVLHFRDALTEAEIRSALYNAKPSTLDEAIQTAIQTESFIEIEAQRKELKCVRKVVNMGGQNNDISERLNQLEKQQNELMELLTDVVAQKCVRKRPRRNHRVSRRCYSCSERGHIQRHCPYLLRDHQPPPRFQEAYRQPNHANVDNELIISKDSSNVAQPPDQVSPNSVSLETEQIQDPPVQEIPAEECVEVLVLPDAEPGILQDLFMETANDEGANGVPYQQQTSEVVIETLVVPTETECERTNSCIEVSTLPEVAEVSGDEVKETPHFQPTDKNDMNTQPVVDKTESVVNGIGICYSSVKDKMGADIRTTAKSENAEYEGLMLGCLWVWLPVFVFTGAWMPMWLNLVYEIVLPVWLYRNSMTQ